MRYILFISILFLFSINSSAQIVFFHEDFELPSLDDSLVYNSTPSNIYHWDINTRLFSGPGSLRCDSCQVKAGSTVYLTSLLFSTVGSPVVLLKFSQICKVDFLDVTGIEVSSNGGGSWTQLTAAEYMGNGIFPFHSNSYGNLWQPLVATNAMWKQETFNLSALIGNCAIAKLRIKLGDGGTVGGNNNAGWFIDNLVIENNGLNPVMGHVVYNNIFSSPISNADVSMVNNNSIVGTSTTNTSGIYQFISSPTGFNLLYVHSNKPWGGVSATDLLLIIRHMIGIPPQLSGMGLLAVDVNGDGLVNAADCLMIYQRMIGMINSFPNGDWVFQYTGFNSPQNNPIIVNIKGLCYGDVNGSYNPSFP